jgi:hypothetical protein
MRMTPRKLCAWAVAPLLALTAVPGCGDGGRQPAPVGEWFTLIHGEWELAPGMEAYRCVRQTVHEDMYVHAFRDVSPPGTHHVVLSMGSAVAPDGEFDCGGATNHQRGLFGSGVGGEEMWLPEGVAVRIPAGHQLLLNMHLLNASHESINGRSGTEVLLVPADEVSDEAETILAGSVTFSIPANDEPHEDGGRCVFDRDAYVSAIMPHMHQLGIHLRVVHGDTVLHDAPYDFEEQRYHSIEPHLVRAGESLEVQCTWLNDTRETVTFGNSSYEEMCFALLYRYPSMQTGLYCTGPL